MQAMLSTDYAYWAGLGANYTAEKDVVAERVLRRIEEYIPAVKGAVRMVDIATPLTYFRMARSYRGAFEGWLPSPEAFFHHRPRERTRQRQSTSLSRAQTERPGATELPP